MTSLRDRLLENTKRPALRLLHRTARGEALIVGLYLEAEQHAEEAAPWEPMLGAAPAWLRTWLDHHRTEERHHAALFATRLAALTRAEAPTSRSGLDHLSRLKLRALHRLVVGSAPRFGAGALVPALAVAWRMEEMGVRVFRRHAEVLAETAADAPLLPVLKEVLADERRHARACRHAVSRLVAAGEQSALASLLKKIDRVERRLGVLGAVALLVAGGLLWIRTALESFTSPSPTGAAT
jgi:hypothetical protein